MSVPWWIDDTPEQLRRGLWQQSVMRWLLRTQPALKAERIIEGYLRGDPGAVEVFELAARRMRQDQSPVAQSDRTPHRAIRLASALPSCLPSRHRPALAGKS